MATIIQVQVRCAGCNRRLADIVNELEGGQVLIELKCPRCGQPHLEVIRPDAAHAPSNASPPRRIGAGLGLILSIMSASLWALPLLAAVLLVISVSAPRAVSASAESIAEVNGEAITSEQVQKALGARLATLERQIYDLKRQKVEAMIDERLLEAEAAKRGVTVEALLDAEVKSKAGAASDAEVSAFYAASKSRLKGNEAELNERIRAHLQNQKMLERRAALIRSLRSQAQIVVNLKEPPTFRAEVAIDGAPFQGSIDAPVTIVEFSDFQCPFCKRVLPTLTELRSRYAGKVRLVFRDFPLDSIHPLARKAAEAARCAKDQNKFWEYHDLLFDNAPKLSAERLTLYARQAGLNVPLFERCLSSGTHTAGVQKDVDEGIGLGVTGTPGFFINGRQLSGAQPLESFVQVIDEELQRAK